MIDMTKKKRVVVKVGTSTLTHSTGLLNIRRVEQLVKTLADLQNAGHEIILVSSGAVGLGRAKLGIKERPKDTPTRQACAAVGQCELMYLYDNLFSEYSLNVAQLLLTKYILLEDRKINVQNALNRIIELGSIPIVNENDTVSIDELELEMGENDSLAANVAVLANADLLIIMSDIEGLFDKDILAILDKYGMKVTEVEYIVQWAEEHRSYEQKYKEQLCFHMCELFDVKQINCGLMENYSVEYTAQKLRELCQRAGKL